MKVLFQAELEFMPLTDILQWIDMNRLSCVVAITRDKDDGMNFYMESGKIIYASSRKAGNTLGDFLVKTHALNESQVNRALEGSRRSDISLPRYLVDNHLISAPALTDTFASLVEQLMIDVFSSRNGSVSVTSPLPDAVLNSPVHLDTGPTVFDAVRVQDEMNMHARKVDEGVEAVKKRLYSEDFQVPVLPGMLSQLVAVMGDENSSFQDMARLIMTDQVLISRIIKIANSSFYGGTGQVDSIQFAIVRLGMREIMNIVTAIQVQSLKFEGVPEMQLRSILDDALKTAFMATGLARLSRLDPEEAFLGGLLLDLGKTVILSVASDFRIEQSLLQELLSTRHTEIGAMVARKWNYPESIQNLIRYHHSRSLGGISNRMIELLQIADQAIQSDLEELDQEQLAALSLTNENVLDVFTKAKDTFNQVKSL